MKNRILKSLLFTMVLLLAYDCAAQNRDRHRTVYFRCQTNPPSTPKMKQIYLDCDDDNYYVWDGSAWLPFGEGGGATEEVTQPIDAYYGDRVQPVTSASGFYNLSTGNNATGYFAENTSTGNGAYAGFTAKSGGVDYFDNLVSMQHFGSGYYVPYLANNSILFSANDLFIEAPTDTGDIQFRLGTTTGVDISDASTDVVLDLKSDRSVTFPSLTDALIDSTGDDSAIDLGYLNTRLPQYYHEHDYSTSYQAWIGEATFDGEGGKHNLDSGIMYDDAFDYWELKNSYAAIFSNASSMTLTSSESSNLGFSGTGINMQTFVAGQDISIKDFDGTYTFGTTFGNVDGILDFSGLSGGVDRIYTIPDASGTIALTSDIPTIPSHANYVDRTATNYMVSGSVLDFQTGSNLRAFSVPTFYNGFGNGSYTYTMPSASGTLALTSDITGTVTANNGLTKTVDNIQLGGSLVTPTTIDVSNKGLTITTGFLSSQALNITNTANGSAIRGTSVNNPAIKAYSTNSTLAALESMNNPASTNDVVPSLRLIRSSSGTGANGIGSEIEFLIKDNSAIIDTNGTIGFELTDVTAGSVDATYFIETRNNDVLERVLEIEHNGTATFSGQIVANNNIDFGLDGSNKAYMNFGGGAGVIEYDDTAGDFIVNEDFTVVAPLKANIVNVAQVSDESKIQTEGIDWIVFDDTTGETTISSDILTDSITSNSGIHADQFYLDGLNTAPASATATGTTGEIRVTATHIYVCTATNTWVRAALSTW